MPTFKVTMSGNNGFAETQSRLIEALSEKHLHNIAIATAQRMQFHILASIQRPGSTGNLANSIHAEKILGGWGVGNIAFLNKKAPYWKWINYGVAGSGRRIPPGTNENPKIKGSFTPGFSAPDRGAFRQGRFQMQGGFPMNPTQAIKPHNYIQRTVQSIHSIVNGVLSNRII